MCSLSAEIIGGNGDLLGLIFIHLPVRSLARFKSVSQQWLALIANSKFRLKHTLENPSSRIPSGLFLYNPVFKDNTVHSISLSGFGGKIPTCADPIELPDDVPIKSMKLRADENVMLMVHSCNGLNLFRFNTFDNQMKSYCVRNLVTNQLKFVPLPKFDGDNYEWISSCYLAFDPLVSPHYKVICVKGMNRIGSKILIFSSETGKWRDTNVTMDDHKLEYAIGDYCHGAIYWIERGYLKLSCYRFDIEAEIMTEISMPTTADGPNFRHFGASYGHLYLVCVRDQKEKVFNVFELNQITMKWSIKHWVHVNRLISSFPQVVAKGRNNTSPSAFSVLSVVRGEEDSALVMNISGEVISYNLRSKKVEVLLSELNWEVQSRRRVEIASLSPIISAYPFIATLYPL
ncbi:hypothetical protein POM88_015439 [Heracleum sosnowskyi]|uniref:F-box domain-containing protein n=1 Tax=Heracleum sosnowskyi TaxID=360622 RepID=A0AAD8IKM6_9APIA|nr:hypothetical protein POM88_015439 [Heracleum sosnowskyi]